VRPKPGVSGGYPLTILLRVVCEEITDKYVVITAYLTSQIKKYWEEK